MSPAGLTMLKKIPFFKKPVYLSEIFPLLIFRWLMIVVQTICIAVLLVCTFVVVLNNVGARLKVHQELSVEPNDNH